MTSSGLPSYRRSRTAIVGSNNCKVPYSRTGSPYQSATTSMDYSGEFVPYDLSDHAVIPWTVGYEEEFYHGQRQHYSNTMSMDTAMLSTDIFSDPDFVYTGLASYEAPVEDARRYQVVTTSSPPVPAERPLYSALPVESPALIPRYMECPTMWQPMLLTPPPETSMCRDDLDLFPAQDTWCVATDTASGIECFGRSKIQFSACVSWSGLRTMLIQAGRTRTSHRPIRSASERHVDCLSPVSADPVSSPDLLPNRKSNPRNDPRYENKPDKDGLYHCPFVHGESCTHAPTKQKCIYAWVPRSDC